MSYQSEGVMLLRKISGITYAIVDTDVGAEARRLSGLATVKYSASPDLTAIWLFHHQRSASKAMPLQAPI